MLPLGRITDVRYQRTWLDRMLGVGQFIFETPGGEALSDMPGVPNPEHAYLVLVHLLLDWPDLSTGAPMTPRTPAGNRDALASLSGASTETSTTPRTPSSTLGLPDKPSGSSSARRSSIEQIALLIGITSGVLTVVQIVGSALADLLG